MKQIFVTAALALLASAPITSFAQNEAPLTRAQVRAELANLEPATVSVCAVALAEQTSSLRQAANQSGTQRR